MIILAGLLAGCLPSAGAGELVTNWQGAMLRVGERELKPVAVLDPPLWGPRFDEGWPELSKDNLIQVRSDAGEIIRTIPLAAGSKIIPTQDRRVAAAYPEKTQGGGSRFVGWISEPGKIGPGQLRILQPAADAKWDLLGAAVAEGREGFLLGRRHDGTGDRPGYDKILLQVFSGTAERPVTSWEQTVAGGEISQPHAFLLAEHGPRQVTPGLLPLVPCADSFLVTPGPQDPIYCIDPGKKGYPLRWKLEKPWEFRRGFIGPSVWSHYLSRFGLDSIRRNGTEPIDWSTFVARATKDVTPDYKKEYRQKAETEMAEMKKVEADLKNRCQMSCGPFVVATEGRKFPSIFVAISEAEDTGQWARYLSHTIVYEIEPTSGTPKTMTRLPRNPLGSDGRVTGDTLLWRCEENGIACLEPSPVAEDHFGPGGPDCIGKLKWYVEATPRRHEAWLSSPATGSAFAWTDSGTIAALDDSWVETAGEKSVHLPFQEFQPGREQSDYELLVPLAEPPKPPETNYSRSGKTFRTSGFYLLGITSVAAWEKRLFVTVGFEGGYRTLVFDRN